MMLFSTIHKIVSQLDLIKQRRDFHQYPESAWSEFRTASTIASKLRDLDFQVLVGKSIMKDTARMGVPSQEYLNTQWQRALLQGGNPDFMESMKGGFTAVAGIMKNGPGPVVAMRFDMDALDIEETHNSSHLPQIHGFKSRNHGVMHSCGHDGHASIGLGVAQVISELKEHFQGTIKLIFQPAEEGVKGAKSICESGFLSDVDYIYACHLWSQMPKGQIVCGMNGATATSKFDIIFKGKAAHAGIDPDQGHNALLAAATATLNLHAIPLGSNGQTRINVGKLQAGSGRNIIPDKAILSYETRGKTSDLNQDLVDRSIHILKSAASMHHCGIEVLSMGGAKSAKSSIQLSEHIASAANSINYFDDIILQDEENRGSEDFTFMMETIEKQNGKASFIGIGANINDHGHHTNVFDFDEAALAPAVELFSVTLFNLLAKKVNDTTRKLESINE